MIPLTIGELARMVGSEAPEESAGLVVSGSVETDSRLVTAGSIFFAMPGETTDGHLFASDAVARGAALVVAEHPVDVGVPVVLVARGTDALAALAHGVVDRVRSRGRLKVAAVTGSNGKTTTKNLLRAILEAEGPTVAPPESFNNQVGAPISMLRVDDATEFLVVEMGAGHSGEIAHLIRVVTPDVGVVLKVGMAHAGEFGGIEQTAKAKAEMVTDLPPTAVALLNADDPRVMAMRAQTKARIVTFGLSQGADLRAEDVATSIDGTRFTLVADGVRRPVALRILGEHHVFNALAALGVAREFGVGLDRAVAALAGVPRAERWRMELLDAGNGITVINDAYNASPDSMAAALRTLAQLTERSGRSVAVLGEMAELGEYAADEHDAIGRLAVRLNIGQLVVVGERARSIHLAAAHEGSWDGESVFVADPEAAYALLREQLRAGDVVLVKSSKSANLRFLGDRLAGIAALAHPEHGGVGA